MPTPLRRGIKTRSINHHAHNLVSTAGNLGVKRASRLADAVQKAVRDDDAEGLGPAVTDLLDALDGALAELPKLDDEASAA
ncbi:MAG: Hpt domain-containing protein [Rhodospirillales bacterium]|nr:Hpt domain-containing protein [Rhodospirillales bacterium]